MHAVTIERKHESCCILRTTSTDYKRLVRGIIRFCPQIAFELKATGNFSPILRTKALRVDRL